jgi:nucleotide-binding universal stress UspA family protein
VHSFRQFVIGFDGREDGYRATRWASAVAQSLPGTVLHLTHALALPAVPLYSQQLSAEELLANAEGEIRNGMESTRRELAASGVAAEIHIRRWLPADTLIEQAQALDAALIVVGQHGGRAHRILIGSTSSQVSRAATVPVVVARGAVRPSPPRRIVVGADGSPGSRSALATVRVLFPRARLVLLSVRERAGGLGAGELADLVQAEGIDPQTVELHSAEGDAAAALLALAASAGADLLCAGRRGRGPLQELLLGSVSEKLLQLAPCPLLLSH